MAESDYSYAIMGDCVCRSVIFLIDLCEYSENMSKSMLGVYLFDNIIHDFWYDAFKIICKSTVDYYLIGRWIIL